MNDNRENFKEINTNLSYLALEVQRVRTCNGILEMIFPLQIHYGFLSCCSILPIIRPIFELFFFMFKLRKLDSSTDNKRRFVDTNVSCQCQYLAKGRALEAIPQFAK
jgi:hypothetical protein